jgi:dehydrogenase/reductase SDR family protein 7B
MSYDFSDKVIWITGSSSGIGEALSYALAGRGAKLILSSRRADELERVRMACAHPEAVKAIPLDLLEISSFAARTAEAIAVFGRIDIVIHNGSVSGDWRWRLRWKCTGRLWKWIISVMWL